MAKVDVTQEAIAAAIVPEELRAIERMMKQNRGVGCLHWPGEEEEEEDEDKRG